MAVRRALRCSSHLPRPDRTPLQRLAVEPQNAGSRALVASAGAQRVPDRGSFRSFDLVAEVRWQLRDLAPDSLEHGARVHRPNRCLHARRLPHQLGERGVKLARQVIKDLDARPRLPLLDQSKHRGVDADQARQAAEREASRDSELVDESPRCRGYRAVHALDDTVARPSLEHDLRRAMPRPHAERVTAPRIGLTRPICAYRN